MGKQQLRLIQFDGTSPLVNMECSNLVVPYCDRLVHLLKINQLIEDHVDEKIKSGDVNSQGI